jgi:hypothetical protein
MNRQTAWFPHEHLRCRRDRARLYVAPDSTALPRGLKHDGRRFTAGFGTLPSPGSVRSLWNKSLLRLAVRAEP